MSENNKKTVILGASNKPQRYSYMAQKSLMEKGHPVIPVHPVIEEIMGVKVTKKITDISEDIHTVTLYVGSERVEALIDDIIALKPERIISNPGTENSNLKQKAKESGIEFVEGCTLVMLSIGEY
jgi:uncharacterized protein